MQSERVYASDPEFFPAFLLQPDFGTGAKHGLELVQGRGAVPIPSYFLFESDTPVSADPLPDLPIMLVTRLGLELLLQEPVLDLRAVSAIILDDLGATLQILRLMGDEYPLEEERPVRMEDCIASLETETWFAAVCASPSQHTGRSLSVWQHARRIGCYVEELALLAGGILPGEGQLIGLLHELGRLPEVLGWQTAANGLDDPSVGVLLAEYWHLPACVVWANQPKQTNQANQANQAAEQAGEAPESCSYWEKLLAAAHLRAHQEDAGLVD